MDKPPDKLAPVAPQISDKPVKSDAESGHNAAVKVISELLKSSLLHFALDEVKPEKVGLSNILEDIVGTLKDRKELSYLFQKPVSKKEAPDYFDIIEHPMDLSKMRDKVRRLEYKSREEFRHDMYQIAYNAHRCNDRWNPVPKNSSNIPRSYFSIKDLVSICENYKLDIGVNNMPWLSYVISLNLYCRNLKFVQGSKEVMVCQGASQTRFKALKHENGISGRTTIIVRVIACFQPLQICQAEYFLTNLRVKPEHYPGCFGWMVTSRELQTRQHFSAWNFPLPTLDCMALTQSGQVYSSPCPPRSSRFSVGMDFSPCSVSGLPDLNSVQLNEVDGFFKGLPPLWESSSPSIHPHSKDSQCAVPHGLGVSASIIDASHTCLKRFLVVDQSGNHTRLFFNPFPPSQNQIVSSKTHPGVHASWLKSTDPLLIIDKAIDYLKSLKYEAESPKVSYPQVFNGAVG
ncbi:unnamed protein product [Fraxinus pennsylvanica]|uniref:Bromo domain-containing protein n=1 Tax=Fraxinus pennsylvanica TaxID=56036 RepID=A0AAD1ZGJ6_9LAMI|nr:unnamed protein product [Fraxinus pennsylvanica]